MNFRCVAFDMDGTLTDTMPFWRRAVVELAEERGVVLPEEVLPRVLNCSCEDCLATLKELYPDSAVATLTIEDIMNYMERCYREKTVLCKGAAAYVKRFHDAGLPLCIISATPRRLVKIALEQVGLYEYFSFVLTPEDFPRGKEDPAIFREAARRFGFDVTEMALVDDALYSLRTAKSLGIYCIGTADAAQQARTEKIRALCNEYYAEELGVK